MERDDDNPENIDEREERLYALRDRLLLYLRSMGLGAGEGMELAAECLKRAGPDPRIEKAFDELSALLRERNPHPPAPGAAFASAPPLNRRAMVAGRLPAFRCLALPRKLAGGLLALPAPWKKSWTKE